MMAGVRRTVKIMTKKDTMIPQMHDWKKHDVIRKRGDLKGATKVPFLIIFFRKNRVTTTLHTEVLRLESSHLGKPLSIGRMH
jgi:hypothetical protein